MKAIFIAAGMGRRLAPITDDAPKCLTEVNGKTILDRCHQGFREAGINDIYAVRGYRGELLEGYGMRLFDNPLYRENNILLSLFYAREAMDGPFMSTYSDIVFHPQVVKDLLATPGDIVLVVDKDWRTAYQGRTLHPIAEGEVCLATDGKVTAVGKGVPAVNELGEFIGLAKYSAKGAARMRAVFEELEAKYKGKEDQPFQRAPMFRKAYLTDLYNELISRGDELNACVINGDWCEIDTLQDLERAQRTTRW